MCWSDPTIRVTSVLQHKQFHCSVKMDGFSGILTAVYGSPNHTSRKDLWELLRCIASNMQNEWILLGDFNTFLHPENKKGDRPVSMDQCKDF